MDTAAARRAVEHALEAHADELDTDPLAAAAARWLGRARVDERVVTGSAAKTREPVRALGRSHKVGAGQVGTGEFAHAWAFELKELIAAQVEPLEVVFPAEPEPYQRALVEALGATVVVEPAA